MKYVASELWTVVCRNGRPCNLPGFAGTSWEDEREPPYYKKGDAEAVVRHLDDPTSWDCWNPEILFTKEQLTEAELLKRCRAPCGPHSAVRYVRDDGGPSFI